MKHLNDREIGDTVYFMKGKHISTGKIVGVNVSYNCSSIEVPQEKVNPKMITVVWLVGDGIKWRKRSSDELFNTFEEVGEHLSKNIKGIV